MDTRITLSNNSMHMKRCEISARKELSRIDGEKLVRLNLKVPIHLIVITNRQFTEMSFTLEKSFKARTDAKIRTPLPYAEKSTWSVFSYTE